MVVERSLKEFVLLQRGGIEVPAFRFPDVTIQGTLDRDAFRLLFGLEAVFDGPLNLLSPFETSCL